MKKFFLLNFLLLGILVISGCQSSDSNTTQHLDNYETYIIQSGSLTQSSNYVGNVEPFEYTIVAAKMGGKIIKLNVNEGDYVYNGNLLAQLDGAESSVAYQSASEMKFSLQQMKRDTENMFDAQITAMEKRVAQSKSALNLTEITLNDGKNLSIAGKQIQQAKLAYEAALAEYNHTASVLIQQESSIYSNASNALSQSKILLENIGIFIDEVIGVSPEKEHINDTYEIYLGAKNTKLKTETENLRKNLSHEYKILGPTINTAISLSQNIGTGTIDNHDQLIQTLKSTEIFLEKVRILLTKTDQVLNNSLVGVKLTQTMLDGFKAKILSMQNNLEQVLISAQGNFLLGIKGSLQAFEGLDTQSNMKLDLLSKKLALAENQYTIAKESIGTQSDISQQQYEESLAGLQALKEQKASQLSQIASQVTQLEGNQDMANVQLNNARITAPFEGVIMEKFANLGQVVGPGTPIFSLGSNKIVKISVQIPESRLENIQIGDKTIVYIHAIQKTLTGQISKISPLVDRSSKKVPIEINIPNLDQTIKLGMYAEVQFNEGTYNGLNIPLNFVKYEFGEAYVYVLNEDKAKKVFIQIQDCNNRMCLIVRDKLKIDDIIIQ